MTQQHWVLHPWYVNVRPSITGWIVIPPPPYGPATLGPTSLVRQRKTQHHWLDCNFYEGQCNSQQHWVGHWSYVNVPPSYTGHTSSYISVIPNITGNFVIPYADVLPFMTGYFVAQIPEAYIQ
jgi:hypothetical protein